MSFLVAFLVSALSGFVALSWEILWYRLIAFASGGSPASFGLLLGAYLAGIAVGALRVRRHCHGEGGATTAGIAGLVLVAGLVAFVCAPLAALIRVASHWLLGLLPIFVAAGLSGAILPLLAHAAIAPDERAGQRLARLYLGNILGATAGSLVTGFVLLDRLDYETIAALLLMLSSLTAALLATGRALRPDRIGLAALALLLVALPLSRGLHRGFWDRLLHDPEHEIGPVERVVQNRHGVIAVTTDHTVFGDGAYDGRISTSLVEDVNWVIRPYFLAALERRPKEVLVIGLALGAWTQIVANLPGVEKVTVIEINPGYLELIPHYEPVASLIDDPRLEFVVDDGRRWLQRHPERRFDLIVQNTTWHWRAQASNLLSREYLELTRSRLGPGGTLILNTTFSEDAMRTTMAVFPECLRVYNAMIASTAPFHFDKERWRANLLAMRLDGRPVFDLADEKQARRLDEVLGLIDTLDSGPAKEVIESRAALERRLGLEPVITDDNMLSEFRRLHW
ncbi:MAG: fused MFS/spermidine synthase [Planctomycetes bacterium]|nr:fused MFS/spermidine synthase [Planctomycetota bacterium]